MQWKINKIKTVEEFYADNYGDRDIPADPGDCMEMMEAYAKHVLDGVVTNARVYVRTHVPPTKSRTYTPHATKEVWVRACSKSILEFKDRLTDD